MSIPESLTSNPTGNPAVSSDHAGPPRRPALDEQGRLAEPLTCLQCGYNLRGLIPAGTCPECGLAVEVSAGRGRLAFADRAWLRELYAGLDLLTMGPLMPVPIFFAVLVLLSLVDVLVRPWSPWAMKMITAAGLSLATTAAPGLLLYGLWRFTRPEPGGPPDGLRSAERARIRARWAGMGAILLIYLAAWLVGLGFSRSGLWATGLGLTAGMIAAQAGGCWAAHLARRLPAPRLARLVRVTACAQVGVGAIWLLAIAANNLLPVTTGAADALMGLAWLGAVVTAGATWIVAIWFSQGLFKEALGEVRQG